jgi:hypothetical protein
MLQALHFPLTCDSFHQEAASYVTVPEHSADGPFEMSHTELDQSRGAVTPWEVPVVT